MDAHNCLSRLELDTQFPSIVAPEDDGLDDMARDIDDPVLQHGRRIARSISDGMFKHGRTRRDNTGGTVAPTVAFCDCVLEHPEVTPPPCAQVAPINAEHAGCVGESNPRSLPSTLAASGSAAREGRPQSTRSTLAALGSATPRTLPSTLAASGSAMAVPCPLSTLVTSVRFAELPKVLKGSFPKTFLTSFQEMVWLLMALFFSFQYDGWTFEGSRSWSDKRLWGSLGEDRLSRG